MTEIIKTAKVKIWGKTVGVVYWDNAKKTAQFQYNSQFLNSGIELSPIYMPLSDEIYNFRNLNFETYRGLPGLLADSLPDTFGNKIIDAWLAQQGRSKEDFSPVERLCYIGDRGMGALEFEPVISEAHTSPLQISQLVSLASQILKSKQQFKTTLKKKDSLKDILSVGTSAGGQRPKSVIAINQKTGEVRSGQVKWSKEFEYWLLKFDGISEDQKGYGKIEYAYYLMAKALGIEMSECKLYKEHSRAHFMTKRFDRELEHKHHLQTLCGIAHYDYKSLGAYSYEQVFQIMRKLHFSHEYSQQLFKRMVFNIIARNQDDHTKNISFLLKEDGEWVLSPAYDLTFSYNPESPWTSKHQMTMNGKDSYFVEDDFKQIADSMGINGWKDIMKNTVEIIKDWPDFAKKAGVTQKNINRISKYHRTKLKF